MYSTVKINNKIKKTQSRINDYRIITIQVIIKSVRLNQTIEQNISKTTQTSKLPINIYRRVLLKV